MPRKFGELDTESRQLFEGLHRMVLRLAGRGPDDFLIHLRTLLAGGDLLYLPDTVAAGTVELGVSLTSSDVALLSRTLEALGVPGGPPAGLAQVRTSETIPATDYRFFPAPHDVLAKASSRLPESLDLTRGTPANLADLAEELTDLVDDIAVDGLSEQTGVVRISRAWRFPPDLAANQARRVYLVEVAAGAPAWEIALAAHRELTSVEEGYGQVEVYWTGDVLPPFHQNAHAHAALLWVRR